MDNPLEQLKNKVHLNEKPTIGALKALRENIASMKPEERKDVREQLKELRELHKVDLQNDVQTSNELDALQQDLESRIIDDSDPFKNTEPYKEPDSTPGSTIANNTRPTPLNTRQMLLGGAMLAGVGYGLYRIAKWVKGRPEDSKFKKFLKFVGVVGLAGWTVKALNDRYEAKYAANLLPMKSQLQKQHCLHQRQVR